MHYGIINEMYELLLNRMCMFPWLLNSFWQNTVLNFHMSTALAVFSFKILHHPDRWRTADVLKTLFPSPFSLSLHFLILFLLINFSCFFSNAQSSDSQKQLILVLHVTLVYHYDERFPKSSLIFLEIKWKIVNVNEVQI